MYGNDEESENEDYDTMVFRPSFKPSYVIIAIDNHPTMFQKKDKGVIPFRSCLEACHTLADSLILKQDKRTWSPFAVMIAGESTPLIGFKTSILEGVKILNQLIQMSDGELLKAYQRKSHVDLGGLFLTCKKVFYEIKSEFYKKTLIYVSNDDKPIDNKNSKFTALNEIKTFGASQIDFQIIPTRTSFNYKLFYNELYTILGSKRHEEICIDTEGLTQKLLSTILIKVNERKMLFYPFKGDNERFIKCVRVHLFSNIQLTNSFLTEDGEKLVNTQVPGDIVPYYKIKFINDEKAGNVRLDEIEKNSVMDYSLTTGLTLLFVGDRQIGLGHVFSKPSLIKANPKDDVGVPFFKKFWDNCVAANKVLVCMSKMRQPEKVRYAELIPVLVDGQQMFLEKRLPYGNEIVWPQKSEYPEEEVDENRKSIVQKLVDTLSFDFDPKMLPDVAFQMKKAYVKSKLLDVPMEKVEDVSIVTEQLDDVLEDVVKSIQLNFQLVEEAKKRRAGPSQPGKSKRFK